MKAIPYSRVRSHFARTLQKVCEDHAPIMITRQGKDAVVMMSLEEYESLNETAYLLQNPKNAKRLLVSIKELERGKGKKRKVMM